MHFLSAHDPFLHQIIYSIFLGTLNTITINVSLCFIFERGNRFSKLYELVVQHYELLTIK